MNEPNRDQISDRTEEEIDSDTAQPNRKQPPRAGSKAAFIAPELVKAGELADITAGFSSHHYP